MTCQIHTESTGEQTKKQIILFYILITCGIGVFSLIFRPYFFKSGFDEFSCNILFFLCWIMITMVYIVLNDTLAEPIGMSIQNIFNYAKERITKNNFKYTSAVILKNNLGSIRMLLNQEYNRLNYINLGLSFHLKTYNIDITTVEQKTEQIKTIMCSSSEDNKTINIIKATELIQEEHVQRSIEEEKQVLNLVSNEIIKSIGPYLKNRNDAELLFHYFQIIFKNKKPTDVKQVKVIKLAATDLQRFAWNIWHIYNQFEKIDQQYFAELLMDVFVENFDKYEKYKGRKDSDDCDYALNIRKKLKTKGSRDKIKIDESTHEYRKF